MPDPTPFERFTVTTGGEEEAHIAERRDAFFDQVAADLGLPDNFPWAERVTRSLNFQGADRLYPTDDWLYQLIVFDETLAMVQDRRDTANYHEVTFWRNLPTQRCLGCIAAALAAKPA